MALFRPRRPRSVSDTTPASLPESTHSVSPSPDGSRWQALLDATDDAVLLTDAAGRVLLSNVVADRLFPPASAADPASHDLLARTLSAELDDLHRETVRRGMGREAEVALRQPSPRTLRVRISPVGEREYLLVLLDLTELRRLERVRRDFVANVSHELRTPLTSIKALAETLLDGARTDEAVAPRFLQTIMHESDRLVRLSADLLDLSRVEARGVEKTSLDLAALVADVSGRLAGQAQKAGLTLTSIIRPPLTVLADRDEMAQVLVNLLDNAIAYTPAGGTITLSALETASSVTIRVTDTGIGILSHDMDRLFERFYRADKARSRASGGTGLGLSIVKHIVESHGGTVGVDSEYNKGSIFWFTLHR